jgi:hypothetical protein
MNGGGYEGEDDEEELKHASLPGGVGRRITCGFVFAVALSSRV